MRKSYNFYSDPGHGWLRVEKKDVLALAIQNKISSCSYKNGTGIFLEEDGDMGVFLDAYKEKCGTLPKINYHTTNRTSRIRKYPSYIAVKE